MCINEYSENVIAFFNHIRIFKKYQIIHKLAYHALGYQEFVIFCFKSTCNQFLIILISKKNPCNYSCNYLSTQTAKVYKEIILAHTELFSKVNSKTWKNQDFWRIVILSDAKLLNWILNFHKTAINEKWQESQYEVLKIQTLILKYRYIIPALYMHFTPVTFLENWVYI